MSELYSLLVKIKNLGNVSKTIGSKTVLPLLNKTKVTF